MRLSKTFLVALKCSDVPQYRIAWAAGVHPNLLSKLIHGQVRFKPQDERLLRVAKILKLQPDEVFDEGDP